MYIVQQLSRETSGVHPRAFRNSGYSVVTYETNDFSYSREEKCHFLGRLLKNTPPLGYCGNHIPKAYIITGEKMSSDTFGGFEKMA